MLPTTFAEMPNPGKCWLGILSRDSLTSVLTSASFPLYKQGHTPSHIEQPIHFTLSLFYRKPTYRMPKPSSLQDNHSCHSYTPSLLQRVWRRAPLIHRTPPAASKEQHMEWRVEESWNAQVRWMDLHLLHLSTLEEEGIMLGSPTL